ncbi:MAG: SDR family NAD(P)-dependent oxidoreductase [Microbacteriaceae bacterium]
MNEYAESLVSLDGQVALVTGATRGIGLACARALGSAGAHVVLTGLSTERPAEIAAELSEQGLSVEGHALDVTDRAAQAALVAGVLARHGHIDTLVCNAGVALDPPASGPQAFDEQANQALTRMFDIHVASVAQLVDLVAPSMAEHGGGSVIVMSSLSAVRGNTAIGLYGVTKAALAQLARNVAVQWGPQNVRANAIAPGVIATEFATPITDDPARAERRLLQTPLRRFGTVDHIAGTVLYLASPAGSFTSGQTVVVDGGTLIHD